MAPGSHHSGRTCSLIGSASALARIEPPGGPLTSHPGWRLCAWRSRQRLFGALFGAPYGLRLDSWNGFYDDRSEEHTSELQSRRDLVCRLLLEKKKRALTRVW